MEDQENRFARGFNSGYFLAEHEPELGIKVLAAAGNAKDFSEYAHGLVSGYAQYANEHSQEQTKGLEATKPSDEKQVQPDAESRYQTGFNQGYLLTKYEPELAKKIITPQSNPSEYQQGLSAGRKEYDIEALNNRLKNLANSKGNTKEQDKGNER